MSAGLICSNAMTPSATQAQRQSAVTNFQFTGNGLTATCRINGAAVALEAQRLSGNSSLSRVRHANGRILAEARRNADTIEIKLPTTTVTLDVANQSLVNFSAEDQVRLQEFLQSSDATIVRTCLRSLLQTLPQARDERGRRVMPLGLVIISMLLGEEPPSADAPQSQSEPLSRARAGRRPIL